LFRTWTNQGKFEFGGGYGPAVESFSATEYFVLRFIKNDPSVVTSWEIGAVNPEDVVATFDPQTGVLTISGTGDMKAFPSNYDYNVTSAPWVLEDATTGTFYPYRDDITSIVIEEGVTNITGVAWGLNNLGGTLTIPSTVTTIGSRAFNGHSFTGEIVIPEGVTTIGSYAFDDNGNSTVTSLKLPSTWDNTGGQYQIFDHMSLTDVYVTTSTTPIAIQNPAGAMFSASTFANATLHIPAGTLDDYQADAFWSRFTNIIEEASVVTSWEIGAVNPEDVVATFDPQTGVLTISGTGAMINFPAIYGDLGYVGSGAPWIATLEYEADGTTLKSITPYAYSNDITSVVIESGVTNIGSNFGWDNNANALTSLTSVTIGEDVVTIGSRAFNGVPLTGSIVIPEGVTTIGSYAFDDNGQGSVTSLTLPSTWVPTSAYQIFDHLNLTEVTVSWLAGSIPATPTPPTNIFTASTYSGATLYVPEGTKSDYEAVEPWNLFGTITEVTAIGTVEAPKAIKSIKYYDLLGRPTTKSAKGIIFQEILYEDGTKAFRKTLVLEK
jgi:hypothetical protein